MLERYSSFKIKEGDIVLIHYWYDDMITPVKVVEKKGYKYRVSHNIDESLIFNAPDEWVKSNEVIDHYKLNENMFFKKSEDSKLLSDIKTIFKHQKPKVKVNDGKFVFKVKALDSEAYVEVSESGVKLDGNQLDIKRSEAISFYNFIKRNYIR